MRRVVRPPPVKDNARLRTIVRSLHYAQKVRKNVKSLTIGHLAKQVGLDLETVRYHERRGLLPRPPRSASGYRLFPAEAARRLKFIRRAQELGFSLTEIGELLLGPS